MNEWEYKTCFLGLDGIDPDVWGRITGYRQSVLTEAQLTQLGSEGWELVSVVRLTTVKQVEVTWGIQYIFKRPKH